MPLQARSLWKAYWFFDREMAEVAARFNGDRVSRMKQMLTFEQDDRLLPVACAKRQANCPCAECPVEMTGARACNDSFVPAAVFFCYWPRRVID